MRNISLNYVSASLGIPRFARDDVGAVLYSGTPNKVQGIAKFETIKDDRYH